MILVRSVIMETFKFTILLTAIAGLFFKDYGASACFFLMAIYMEMDKR